DKEFNKTFSPISIDMRNIVLQDWPTIKDENKYYQDISSTLINQPMIQTRKGWQQGKNITTELISQQIWKYLHPYYGKLNNIYKPLFKYSLPHKSWMYMHRGISQFKQHRLIITNRLHGHILCILMEIPHIFLPNAYYKNEAFYKAWTSSIQFCQFVKEPSKIEMAAQNLLNSFPNNVAV
ncbi:MAG: polysaccharide pyruvyl transferase family protein, partial [Rhizonema sp. PD38]|nr:polysaccharide pyruvyl transferase family protein [Rhizonema sp. PD38]